MVASKSGQARDRSNGRFSYGAPWDRRCTCGHTLGNHLAEHPHGCIESDFAPVACECERFKLARPSERRPP